MKFLLSLLVTCSFALVGCGTDAPQSCAGDNCVCPATTSCTHDCADGAPTCNIQGAANQAVDVSCSHNGTCHVQCESSTSCNVDCGGSTDCHVTCPPSGCTVNGCVGAECVVSCGLGGVATHNGSTATCP